MTDPLMPYPKPRELYYAKDVFLKFHERCDELICRTSDGKPLCAVYYFPPGMRASEVREFFRRVQECSEPPLPGEDP